MNTYLVQRDQPDGQRMYLTTRKTWTPALTEAFWMATEQAADRNAEEHGGKVVTLEQAKKYPEHKPQGEAIQ